jgi:SET domain-containing protein
MKRIPLEERVVVRRSAIHGWGLFALQDIEENEMVIEYVGEAIRQKVADAREVMYDKKGTTNVMGGGCYLFRLTSDIIVDATCRGSIARFMNHSCQPNCSSKIISVDGESHIVIFAQKKIKKFTEITYDYKFPIEEAAIACYCGAENCIGRMN